MKKLIKIVFSLFLLASLFVRPATSTFALTHFAGGDGTENNPYLIETAEQFSAIRADLDAFYALISDIDLSELTGSIGSLNPQYNRGEGWLEIGSNDLPFTGVLDGRGYKISGLAVKQTDDRRSVNMGLFGHLHGATIFNLDLEGHLQSTLQVYTNAGILAHSSEASIISGVRVYGTIDTSTTQSNDLGGLIGGIENTRIYNTESHVNIVTLAHGGNIGGVVGLSINSYFTNVINRGDISALQAYTVGGVVGYLIRSKLSHTQNYGDLHGSALVGGIVGNATQSDIIVAINYGDVKTQSNNAGGVAGFVKYRSEGPSVSSFTLDFLVNYGEVTSILDNNTQLGSIISIMDFEISDQNDHIVIRDFVDFAGGLPLVSTIQDSLLAYQFRIIFDGFRVTGSEYTLDKNSPDKGLIVVVNEFDMLDPNILEDIVVAMNEAVFYLIEATLEEGVIFIDIAQTYYFTQGKVNGHLSEDMVFFNTYVFEALPSVSYGVLSFSDFVSLYGWDFTSIVGWNAERDESGVLFVEGDELNYVRGVAFVRVYATDGIVPVDDDDELIDEEDGDGDGDEELPATSDSASWSWLLLTLGYLGILYSKKKS